MSTENANYVLSDMPLVFDELLGRNNYCYKFFEYGRTWDELFGFLNCVPTTKKLFVKASFELNHIDYDMISRNTTGLVVYV